MSSISAILNATQGLPYAPLSSSSSSSASSYVSTSQTSIVESDSEVAQASVSLSANLNGVSAATGTGQLTLAFARALQTATQVDPTTGGREIIAGANAQLTSTLNALLVQNGFTSAQAASATASLTTELAQGGPINLTASYDQATHASGTQSYDYGPNAASTVSAVDATDRSSSITIGINLATGELNLSLTAQNSSAYASSGKIAGAGTLVAPVGLFLLLPSSTVPTSAGTSGPSGSTQSDFGQVLSNQSLTGLAAEALGAAPSNSGASGFGIASANSPLSESEVDTYSAEEQISLSLTDYSTTGGPNSTSGAPGAVGKSSNFDASVSGSSSYSSSTAQSTGSTSNTSASDTLQQLLAELNQAKLLVQQETSELLQSLPDIAAKAKAAAQAGQSTAGQATPAATDATSDTPESTGSDTIGPSANASSSSSASNTVSVLIGITQTISLQQLDLNGYGDTLYKRPDGSLGKISTQPTHVTA